MLSSGRGSMMLFVHCEVYLHTVAQASWSSMQRRGYNGTDCSVSEDWLLAEQCASSWSRKFGRRQ